MTVISEALEQGIKRLKPFSESARLDAELLLCFAAGFSRIDLISKNKESLAQSVEKRFETLIERRTRHEPIAYITGIKEFWGLEFQVNAAVLIPRPETELLVELALKKIDNNFRILELATGSGCIAIALASELRKRGVKASITATDKSEEALKVARANAARLGMDEITFLKSDWFSIFREGIDQFDLIVTNPPYVATNAKELSPELQFEPREALFSGEKGLDSIGFIIKNFQKFIALNGSIYIEISPEQEKSLIELTHTMLKGVAHTLTFYPDLGGRARALEIALT